MWAFSRLRYSQCRGTAPCAWNTEVNTRRSRGKWQVGKGKYKSPADRYIVLAEYLPDEPENRGRRDTHFYAHTPKEVADWCVSVGPSQLRV